MKKILICNTIVALIISTILVCSSANTNLSKTESEQQSQVIDQQKVENLQNNFKEEFGEINYTDDFKISVELNSDVEDDVLTIDLDPETLHINSTYNGSDYEYDIFNSEYGYLIFDHQADEIFNINKIVDDYANKNSEMEVVRNSVPIVMPLPLPPIVIGAALVAIPITQIVIPIVITAIETVVNYV
jgi:hypothetical protein